MIGKWSTKNAMVMESCEDFVSLFEFWAEQWLVAEDHYAGKTIQRALFPYSHP